MGWAWPAAELSCSLSPTPLTCKMCRKSKEDEIDRLIGEWKVVCASKAKWGTYLPLPISRLMPSHLQESRASAWQRLLGKTNAMTRNVLLSPSFYCWVWCHKVRDIPSVGWCAAVLSVSSPNILPMFSLLARGSKWKKLSAVEASCYLV